MNDFKIYFPSNNTNLRMNIADYTVTEVAEKLEVMAKLLRKLVNGDVDEDGNVNIGKRVGHLGISLEYEDCDEENWMMWNLIVSTHDTVFESGRSKSTVGFQKDFADWAKTGKTFGEFAREQIDRRN